MTRADLKSGYLVETRDRGLFMVMTRADGTKVAINEASEVGFHVNAAEMFDDLTSTHQMQAWDIMAVYGRPEVSYLCFSFSLVSRSLLWKRSEPKKMTVKEICEALGYDVEIVKEAPNA